MTILVKPRVAYIVCGVQRSGSRLLSEALQSTGLAGNPGEYLLCDKEGRWEDPDSWWARNYGVKTRVDYLAQVFKLGTGSNGVFGLNIKWNYFGYALRNLRELPEYATMATPDLMNALFASPKYIWLIRRDKLRQAVSWAKAGQTGIYHIRRGETARPQQKPQFDFTFIDNLTRLVMEGEAGWRAFFSECGVQPLEITYEDFVDSYESTVRRVLEYLGIPYSQDLVHGEITLMRTSDDVNEDWVQRYLQMKEKMPNQ